MRAGEEGGEEVAREANGARKRDPERPFRDSSAAAPIATELLRLQRSIGNRALARALGRRSDPLTRGRGAGNAPLAALPRSGRSPVRQLARWPGEGDRAIYTQARDHLGEVASDFADRWQIQALNAIQTAEEPADPTERQNWWVALAGNVVWVFAGLKAIYWPIALVGAAGGSGVFAGTVAPSGKSDYAKALPAAADAIAHDQTKIDLAAGECARRGVSDALGQDRVLWEQMFPAFPFDSRKAIYDDLSEWLATELKRFRAAYNAWKRGSIDEAMRASKEDYEWTFGPVLRPVPGALVAQVEKDQPFRFTVNVPSLEARAQAAKARAADEAAHRQPYLRPSIQAHGQRAAPFGR